MQKYVVFFCFFLQSQCCANFPENHDHFLQSHIFFLHSVLFLVVGLGSEEIAQFPKKRNLNHI